MRYSHIVTGTFLSRPNRFIAKVLVEGREETVHVKNTGRCKELLVPGATVYLEMSDNPTRKTLYDLVTVEKATPIGTRVVNMDSQAPNKLFEEWARGGHFVPGLTLLRPETTWGTSRFDFYWEADDRAGGDTGPYAKTETPVGADVLIGPSRKGFVEVKGCTLERDGWTYFPDAPTLRGVKHLEELIRARAEGYEAAVCFVIQMAGVAAFSPNDATHPEFGAALRKAAQAGVEVMAYECSVIPGEVTITTPVPIQL